MKLLIIGGTRFLGRAVVDAAAAAGHELTLFNRGQSNPDLYPEIEQLVGDRDGGLEPLRGRRWDAVIDTCGYFPRVVSQSAELLADAVDHYTFISSISVYADPSAPDLDENGTLATMEDEALEEITEASYGPLKVLCEQAVSRAMAAGSKGDRALLVRPGLIVGPHDPSDRFTYWPYRVARGGEVLAPGEPEHPVQIVDVRDLAEWILHAVQAWLTGTYNLAGPAEPLRMGSVLDQCRQISGSDASFTWVSESFLEEHQVEAYTEMPLWVPEAFIGLERVDCRKAIAAGLVFRPLEETIADTLAWQGSRAEDYQWRGGLSAKREAELLAAWHQRA